MNFTNEFKSKNNDSLKLRKWNLWQIIEIQKAGQGDIYFYPSIPLGYKEAALIEMRFFTLKAGRGDLISYPSIPAGFKKAYIMKM